MAGEVYQDVDAIGLDKVRCGFVVEELDRAPITEVGFQRFRYRVVAAGIAIGEEVEAFPVGIVEEGFEEPDHRVIAEIS